MPESTQEKVIVPKYEKIINGVTFQCAPAVDWVNDQKKEVHTPNRVKIGNGFKAIAVLKSQDQITGLIEFMKNPKAQDWVKKNLPVSTQEDDQEEAEPPF